MSFRNSADPTVRFPVEDPLDAVVVSFLDPRSEDSGDEVNKDGVPVKSSADLNHSNGDRELTAEQKKDIRKVTRKLFFFLKDVAKNTSIVFDRKSPLGFRELRRLWYYLIIEDSNATNSNGEIGANLANSSRRNRWFCNVLLNAGHMELEPKDGVVLVPVDTGCRLTNISNVFDRQSRTEQAEILARYAARFSEKLYASPNEISTLVVPINVDQVHWGVFVARQVKENTWEIYWGDSLYFQCPEKCGSLVTAVIDYALRDEKVWVQKKENYMLDVLGYSKQTDSHSCGAYVLSVMSQFARSRGVLPNRFFFAGHPPNLTETYRWACAEARVRMVMAISHTLPVCDELAVSQLHIQRRERISVGRQKMKEKEKRANEMNERRSTAQGQSTEDEHVDSGAKKSTRGTKRRFSVKHNRSVFRNIFKKDRQFPGYLSNVLLLFSR